jgi:hypothetical protein
MLIFGHEGEKFNYTLNIGIESEVGSGSDNDINGDFRAGMSYVYNKLFQPGFEYYSGAPDLNDFNSLSDQQSIIGPVIKGDLTDDLEYELGYLFGMNQRAADGTLKLNLNYRIPLQPRNMD